MALAPGARLAQYEIVEPIGSGGMGEVYRARDARLGRDVAIKVMAPHIASDPEMRRRFETEARAVASLSHPSILSIHELALVDGLPVAVMELLDGENLRSRLSNGPLPWRDAVRIAASVADGLAAAHGRGIVHRDLKPENVFLTTDGGVKILDFGLALQRLDAAGLSPDGPTVAATQKGVVLGTFGYMSPEQVTGAAVDARSDIFALGCVLYEMLTGRPLFSGETPQEVIARLLRDSVPELAGFDPLAPGELRVIVSRSVERDPARRFGSAEDLSLALRALLTGSGAVRRPRARGKSLAVLPFVNAGADPSIEYLTDGITESIINSLSQLGNLRVVPRSLVFRYKGLQADPSTIGLALNARTILTGRVVQQGDTINIQAELVDTSTESQLWGDQFRQKLSELMPLQQEIAWHISEALRLKLTTEQKRKLRKQPTVHPDAYQEYLRGRHQWHNWNPESLRRAREHFERAIGHDPLYALAYSGLGSAFAAMAYYGYVAPEDGFPRARAAALRALDLDPQLADAHATLAMERLFWSWDWDAAERELERALQLDPNLAVAHALYGLFLITRARFDEALQQALRARDLDPLSAFINMGVAWVHHFAGRPAEAAREAQRNRELMPGLEEAGNVLIAAYEALGRFEDAAELMNEQRCWGIKFDGNRVRQAYREGGPRGYWRERLNQMHQPVTVAPAALHFVYAHVHHHLGELDLALDHIEAMIEAHVGASVFVGVDPQLARLRGNPRFETLLRRIGVASLPPTSAPHEVPT